MTIVTSIFLFNLRNNLDSTVEEIIPLDILIASNTPVIEKKLENIIQLATVSRDSWTSMKSIIGKRKQLMPIQRIIIMETGSDSCTTLEDCKQFLFNKQNKDYPKADDIKENFFVGVDGTVYEGRGWSREGQHTYDSSGTSYNSQSIGLSFIGNFTKRTLHAKQWNGTVLFLEKAIIDKHLDVDYKVFHQKQLIGGSYGNDQLYKATKTLKNWKSSPQIIHRKEWGSTLESIKPKFDDVPLTEVIVSNAENTNCERKDDCAKVLKRMQSMGDIIYNFIFGGNDLIFEVRNFDDNQGSLLIGYISENSTQPNKLEELLTYAVNLGKLDNNYTIYYQ